MSTDWTGEEGAYPVIATHHDALIWRRAWLSSLLAGLVMSICIDIVGCVFSLHKQGGLLRSQDPAEAAGTCTTVVRSPSARGPACGVMRGHTTGALIEVNALIDQLWVLTEDAIVNLQSLLESEHDLYVTRTCRNLVIVLLCVRDKRPKVTVRCIRTPPVRSMCFNVVLAAATT